MSTAFVTSTNLVCKNQDVPYHGAYLFTNAKGVKKSALLFPPETPATWEAKYGSITVSQIGKEFPNGGMNEAGLVVEQTTLWQTEYEQPDSRPAVSELQWIQYMLDTCKDVDEVLNSLSLIRITNDAASRLHYLIADASGHTAMIEFIQGKMQIYSQSSLALPILVNSPYIKYNQSTSDNDPQDEIDAYERSSLERFRVIEQYFKQAMPSQVMSPSDKQQHSQIDEAFEVLAASRRADTVYSLVYDPQQLKITYSKAGGGAGCCHLSDHQFGANDPAHVLDLQEPSESVTVPFKPYSYELNSSILAGFFLAPELQEVFGWSITEETIAYFASYPQTFQVI